MIGERWWGVIRRRGEVNKAGNTGTRAVGKRSQSRTWFTAFFFFCICVQSFMLTLNKIK